MKIGIVNDLSIAREAIRRVVVSNPGLEIAWMAADGAEGVQRTCQDKPDLVLMDLFMPVLDGVQATRRIMSENPCPILIVTATVGGHLSKVYEAMGWGALDAVDTPTFGRNQDLLGSQPLLKKIDTISKLIGYHKKVEIKPDQPDRFCLRNRSGEPLVVIGASTGGPSATAEILAVIPKGTRSSIVIVQHIDVSLASGLARWLTERSGHSIKIASPGHRIEPGEFLLSGTNDHMILGEGQKLHYSREPLELNYRPSVNLFFESLLKHWPDPGIAVLLTGMGADGASGLLGLKKSGWMTVAQDEATSVVYGMPKEAAKLGAASHILPIGQIGPMIREQLELSHIRKDYA